jgi:hypothetical protein
MSKHIVQNKILKITVNSNAITCLKFKPKLILFKKYIYLHKKLEIIENQITSLVQVLFQFWKKANCPVRFQHWFQQNLKTPFWRP